MTRKRRASPRNKEALWVGVDPDTKAFFDQQREAGNIRMGLHAPIREWFVGCRDAGLDTSLNADFSQPDMAAHLEQLVDASCYEGLVKTKKIFIQRVRDGLRLYVLALEAGRRTLPPPAIAIRHSRTWEVSPAEAIAHLPPEDRAKLAGIEERVYRSAKQQWQGNGAAIVMLPTGRKHKATVSLRTARQLSKTVSYFIRHAYAQKWEPFTLDGILTPERVCNFLYYSKRFDGGKLRSKTVENRETQLLDFFERGRLARPTPIVAIDEERERQILAAMREEQLHKVDWDLAPANTTNTGEYKWFPTIAEVVDGIRALEEQLRWAEQMKACGRLTERQYWYELRDTTLALCTLFCMWRVDTASTGSLIHLRSFNGAKVNEHGFAVMEGIARAKNATGDWYPFVPELILPPNVVRYIEKLLAYEGRSLAKPLREGEKPVRLSADNGDVWGNDAIPEGSLTVVPIFRRHPDAPEPLSYSGTQKALDKKLQFLRWGATNPHTLRAAGAIYWTFVQEMPIDLLMTLGLWENEETVRECYARIQLDDKCERMARYVPFSAGLVPQQRGRREKVASSALTVLGRLLEKTTNPYEARRYLLELRRHCEEIDQTIAADLGLQWEPQRLDPLEPGELEKLNAFLVGAGYEAGLKGVLGRDVLARDAMLRHAAQRAQRPESNGRLRRLGSLTAAAPLAGSMKRGRRRALFNRDEEAA